ncbi:MAG: endonuclease domain-containing protein [Allosphingosinicella sp.]
MSLPEVLLWRELRKRPAGFKFRRQYPEDCYILDFACLETRTGIEVDGEVHGRGDRPQRGERRDARLREVGFTIFRVPARDVLQNLEGVVKAIVEECRFRGPLHRPAEPAGPPPRTGEDCR